MLNDREKIEAWHLQDVVSWLALAILALLITAGLLFVLALAWGIRALGAIASLDLGAAALVWMFAARVNARLRELEELR